MSKLDEVKEILNTLRVALSLSIGILIFVLGAIVKRYDANNIDLIFWTGIVILFSLLVLIVKIVRKLSLKTKEIRSL